MYTNIFIILRELFFEIYERTATTVAVVLYALLKGECNHALCLYLIYISELTDVLSTAAEYFAARSLAIQMYASVYALHM